MPSPLVTVIVPVYNLAPYLENTIQSLVGQTYSNTELIFINDGSTDRSLEILQAAAEKYPNIRCLQQENAGQGAARNKGLDHATGEFVIFLDGDDWMDPVTLERAVEAALKENAEIVCFGYKSVKKQDGKLEELYKFEHAPSVLHHEDLISCFLAENTVRKEALNTATLGKLYKRSLIETHNIRFRQRIFEDSPFMLEAVYYATRLACISGFLYYYLQRGTEGEASTMNSGFRADKVALFYQADQLMKSFLRSKGIWSEYRNDFMRYHNARVIIYGGYFELYRYSNTAGKEAYRAFIKLLQKHSTDLGWQKASLHKTYRKRVPVLQIGLFLSRISPWLANRYFRTYEKKYAFDRPSSGN
ncbi:glycosyltransferase family 2 protein [Chitinophaga sp. G-6-1-13]|uniref:Glycosyltransferase family 2 protein n=1 Tax=Chitinophaga fulva TaxID=2728842 RepID=A0A848GL21_9BACT|nr:glycosyltransferase family 2 protein [Chitinophaga fulva]NML38341.1 glycosyltransferase family 2 protein [Chitinophaga fulva]